MKYASQEDRQFLRDVWVINISSAKRDIRTMVPKAFEDFGVIGYFGIVVLRPVQPIVGDVQRDRVVPRLGDAVPVVL